MPLGIANDMEMSWVGDWIGKRARISPHINAVFDSGCNKRFTFEELNQRANKIANFLLKKGVKKGDPISLIAQNRIEFLDLFFAAGKIGAILSPLSYRLKKVELDDLIRRINPKVFIYEKTFKGLYSELDLPSSVSLEIEISEDEHCQYDRIIESSPTSETNIPLKPDDPFLYIHTGGTTSIPKICEISHRQMIWNSVEMATISSGVIGTGVELITLPFFHIGGLNIIVPYFHFGGSIILIRSFDPAKVIELIDSEGVDVLPAVPTMLYLISSCDEFKNASLKTIKGVFTGGSSCPKEIMEPFFEKGVQVIQSYGLTEAGPSNFMFFPKTLNAGIVKEKVETVGGPMFHCDYKIVCSETGEELPQGEIGVLKLRSPHTFSGYLNDPENTSKILDSEGWLDSGDLACEDEEGFVSIKGRANNMFISGGENISPEEIENVLQQHDEIASSLCAGAPDEVWGHVPVAEVALEPGSNITVEEITEYCKSRLADYKVPKKIIIVDALPLTGAGKPDRKNLVDKILKEY